MRTIIHTVYNVFCFSKLLFLYKIYTAVFRTRLWLNNIHYGKQVVCFNAIPILQINRKAALVNIEDYVTFNAYTSQSWYCGCTIIVLENAELKIGRHSGMNGVLIYCAEKVTIGDYVNIGGGTRIFDSNQHNLCWQERRDIKLNPIAKTAPIFIEDDVFIGADCMIEKGITIGARSIIAAGSVVVKSIPADEIWGGNPARYIKKINP